MATLTFLGAGDSQGVPRWWCHCSVCAEARDLGRNARTRPSVLLAAQGERVLLDAAPELRLQLTRTGMFALDTVLISHAHSDHILGLGDVADGARWTKKPVPLFAPAEVIPQLAARFDYLTKGRYRELVPMHPLESATRTFADYRVTPHKVPHGYNGFSYGFRFDKADHSWAYISDSINITDLAPWQGLELLVLGTSFYKENAPVAKRSVYDVSEAIKLVKQLTPARTIFTHLSHGIDCRKDAPAGTCYAYDGLTTVLAP